MLVTKALLNHFNLSFSGSGYLLVYQLGAAKCLLENGQQLMKRVKKFAGASGGSLVATMLTVVPENLQLMLDRTYMLAEEARRKPIGVLTPGFKLLNEIEKLLEEMLPSDAHLVAQNRVHVSITSLKDYRNVIVTDFANREELIQCIKCSCFIPLFCGVQFPRFRDTVCIDGGYSCNLPRFEDGRTVAVTPFSGEKDISPIDVGDCRTVFFKKQTFCVNVQNAQRIKRTLWPPSHHVLKQVHKDGYEDAAKFLKTEGWFERS